MNQHSCKVIGITGGIATGKSTVTKILINFGYEVIDADKIAREVVEKGENAYNDIIKYFGSSILRKDGNIDRKKLGEIIFNDKKKREKLNIIVHPQVIKKIIEKINLYCHIEKVVFVDIPLLIENIDYLNKCGLYFDEIWLVYLNKEEQLKRLIKRDNLSIKEGEKRINVQMPIELKKKYATKIIDNSKEINNLEKQVKCLVNTII